MSDLSDAMSDWSESDDDSMDSADIVILAETRPPEMKTPPTEPTVVPSIQPSSASATSTSIIIDFCIRHTDVFYNNSKENICYGEARKVG
jgi:hypothetical protein